MKERRKEVKEGSEGRKRRIFELDFIATTPSLVKEGSEGRKKMKEGNEGKKEGRKEGRKEVKEGNEGYSNSTLLQPRRPSR